MLNLLGFHWRENFQGGPSKQSYKVSLKIPSSRTLRLPGETRATENGTPMLEDLASQASAYLAKVWDAPGKSVELAANENVALSNEVQRGL